MSYGRLGFPNVIVGGDSKVFAEMVAAVVFFEVGMNCRDISVCENNPKRAEDRSINK